MSLLLMSVMGMIQINLRGNRPSSKRQMSISNKAQKSKCRSVIKDRIKKKADDLALNVILLGCIKFELGFWACPVPIELLHTFMLDFESDLQSSPPLPLTAAMRALKLSVTAIWIIFWGTSLNSPSIVSMRTSLFRYSSLFSYT